MMRVLSRLSALALGIFNTLSCEKSRTLPPPKAVTIREDGVLELSLMSFNIRYESPEDLNSHAWPNRLANCVKMIRREQPDLIGIQEALHGQAADLWASLPDYEFFGIGRDDGATSGEYSGIFYRRHRFRVTPEDGGTFWLSDTPEVPGSHTWGNEIPRTAMWLRLTDLATGRPFTCFNTHWDHRHQPSRERAALLLANRIDARKFPAEPIILLGDFNATESNPSVAFLTGQRSNLAGSSQIWKNSLVDTFQTLHAREKNRRTLHFWENRRTGSLKVDHILVSRDAKIDSAEIVSSDPAMVSDHFPVTARVKFFPAK